MPELPSLLDDLTGQMSLEDFNATTWLLVDFEKLWKSRGERPTKAASDERELAEYWYIVGNVAAWSNVEKLNRLME